MKSSASLVAGGGGAVSSRTARETAIEKSAKPASKRPKSWPCIMAVSSTTGSSAAMYATILGSAAASTSSMRRSGRTTDAASWKSRTLSSISVAAT